MRRAAVVLGMLVLGVGSALRYWYARRNGAFIAPSLPMESWDAVKDGSHNSNTDLIYWRGAFYLIHASSPWHLASKKCKLVVRRSEDAHSWEKIAELNVPGEDIRDPKFAAIGDRLFLYALKNRSLDPEPYATVFTSSKDGFHWPAFEDMQPGGWLFWRPKTMDGLNWYVPAYWHEHGSSALLKSTDGEHWSIVSLIYEGERNDETDIEFLPDGRMISTARLEGSGSFFGSDRASTLISVSAPPFESWSHTKSDVTRLDGPNLFAYGGRTYAVGRYQPSRMGPFTKLGSIFGRKRTSLFSVEEQRLVYLSDLPSSGDTSYAGVAIRGDDLYVSYYTSDIRKDPPWIMGMLVSSDIRMARVHLPSLEELARLAS